MSDRSNYCLRARMDMDVLDNNPLLSATAKLGKNSAPAGTTSQISEPALSQPKRPEQKIFSRNRSFRPALPALTQLTCTDKGQGHAKNCPVSEARLLPTKSPHHEVPEAGRSRT
jgi:hypothetical protein